MALMVDRFIKEVRVMENTPLDSLTSYCLSVFNFRHPEQVSGTHYMVKDQQYYVELLRREWGYEDHAEIMFLEPDRNIWLPMTTKYLRKSR